ncbi:hypothetical protein AN219_37950 [Streptomyces nanshensis]|nr:hypothetical protein AN219_37950 [Streptomyces nanshensis]
MLSWVAEHGGVVTACRDVSSDRPGSRVWELILADGKRCFLKISPTETFYRRETTAYRNAVPLLNRAGAPRLLACSDEQRALLLTAAPGTPVPSLSLTPLSRWAVHEQAGAALRRYHQHTGPDDQGRVHVRADADLSRTAGRVERHLEQAGALIDPQWRTLVRACAAQVSSLGSLPSAFVHGDWQERNWLWHAGDEHLAVVDFERSRFGPAVSDLVRLAYDGPWGEQPDLQAAFMTGYGRTLSVEEERALPALAAVDAASGMAFGREHDDGEVIARAARTLTLLAKERTA